MSNENSINARLLGAGLVYLGEGGLFAKGMDLSRQFFKIGAETKERMIQLHDAAYSTAFSAVTAPLFYYGAGVRDLKQIALATAAGMGMSFFLGGPMGYSVDVFRDLTGIKESSRIPKIVKRINSKIKKGLVALTVAGSLGLTAGIYAANNYQTGSEVEKISQEEISYNDGLESLAVKI